MYRGNGYLDKASSNQPSHSPMQWNEIKGSLLVQVSYYCGLIRDNEFMIICLTQGAARGEGGGPCVRGVDVAVAGA